MSCAVLTLRWKARGKPRKSLVTLASCPCQDSNRVHETDMERSDRQDERIRKKQTNEREATRTHVGCRHVSIKQAVCFEFCVLSAATERMMAGVELFCVLSAATERDDGRCRIVLCSECSNRAG